VPTAESIRGRCAGLAALAAGQTGLLPGAEAHARRDCSPSKGTDLSGYARERPVTGSAPGPPRARTAPGLPLTPAAASAASIARGVLGGAVS
ncbi:MAG: hypothetical protein ACR2NV_01700, partial [Thermoleophilaceae bacterium]